MSIDRETRTIDYADLTPEIMAEHADCWWGDPAEEQAYTARTAYDAVVEIFNMMDPADNRVIEVSAMRPVQPPLSEFQRCVEWAFDCMLEDLNDGEYANSDYEPSEIVKTRLHELAIALHCEYRSQYTEEVLRVHVDTAEWRDRIGDA